MYMLNIRPNDTARPESAAAILRGGIYGGHQFMHRVIAGDFVYCQPREDAPVFMAYTPEFTVNTPGGFRVEAKPFPAIAAGTRLQFTLSANATRAYVAIGSPKDGRGQRIGVVSHWAIKNECSRDEARLPAAEEWLRRQQAGFGLESWQLDNDRRVQFDRKGALVTLDIVDLSGVLTVTESAQFTAALAAGFGRAKRFGYGMMLVKKGSVDS